jgi:hypothetical protein
MEKVLERGMVVFLVYILLETWVAIKRRGEQIITVE